MLCTRYKLSDVFEYPSFPPFCVVFYLKSNNYLTAGIFDLDWRQNESVWAGLGHAASSDELNHQIYYA